MTRLFALALILAGTPAFAQWGRGQAGGDYEGPPYYCADVVCVYGETAMREKMKENEQKREARGRAYKLREAERAREKEPVR